MDTRYLHRLAGTKELVELEPCCIHCGYDLRGSPLSRCPECGNSFDLDAWRKEVDRTREILRDFANFAVLLRLGLWIAAGCAALRAGMLLFDAGDFVLSFTRFLSLIGGVVAFFIGLGVLRLSRLPQWARAQLKNQPSRPMAVASVVLGTVLVLSAVLSPL